MSLRVAAAAVATVFVPAAGDLLVTLEPGTAPTPGDPSGPRHVSCRPSSRWLLRRELTRTGCAAIAAVSGSRKTKVRRQTARRSRALSRPGRRAGTIVGRRR